MAFVGFFFLRIKNQSALNRQWLRNADDSTLGLSENVIELAVAAALYPSTFFYVQIIALNCIEDGAFQEAIQ